MPIIIKYSPIINLKSFGKAKTNIPKIIDMIGVAKLNDIAIFTSF